MIKCRVRASRFLGEMFPVKDRVDRVIVSFVVALFLLLSATCGSLLAELSVIAGVVGGLGFMAFSLWALHAIQRQDRGEQK